MHADYKDWSHLLDDMVVFLNRGPQYEPQNTIVLIMGTPKKVPLILGNPHIEMLLKNSKAGMRQE